MPDGAKKYKSKISKDASYKFEKPGVYLYQCTPHKAMGMIGIVVVGDDKSNLAAIKKVKVYGKSKKILKSLLKAIIYFKISKFTRIFIVESLYL